MLCRPEEQPISHGNIVVGRITGEIRSQLAQAHVIANTAHTGAVEGQVDRALTISLELEELIYSAHLLQAATLNRTEKEATA